MLRLAHLSDIHFGGYGDGWDEDEDQRSELTEDLRRLVEADGPIDGVLVGGDIAYSAQPAEYQTAREWLAELCATGGCHDLQVWTVPGNHDLDRSSLRSSLARQHCREVVLEAPLTEVDKALRDRLKTDPAGEGLMAPLAAYNDFASYYNCSVLAAQPYWVDNSLSVGDEPIRLTGLNSVLLSDTRDTPPPTLVLGEWQCKQPRRRAPRIRIAFFHHPPSWIRDWTNVERYLLSRQHMVLYGHLHEFKAHQRVARGTVEVYAGAVGPERAGDADDAPAFVPSWNLITFSLIEDVLHVTVDPRVWIHGDTMFDRHPDGVQCFEVGLELPRALGPEPSGGGRGLDEPGPEPDADSVATGDEGDLTEGLPASPLVPEVEADALPDGDERARRRDLGVQFMRRLPTARVEIARRIGIEIDFEPSDMPDTEVGRELLARIRDADLIDSLAEELARG